MDQDTWDQVADKLKFTERQKQIVERLLHGRQNKEIASDLSTTVHNVDKQLKSLYRYTNCGDRTGLVIRICGLAIRIATSSNSQRSTNNGNTQNGITEIGN